MKKGWFNYFIYISIAFLLFALYKADYLHLPIVYKPLIFVFAFISLFAGFIMQSVCWHSFLQKANYNTPLNASIAGMGLSVFAKYIPGKVLVILGRAGYISEKFEKPLSQLSALSLQTQLTALWAGLTVGTFSLFAVPDLRTWGIFILALYLALSLAIFNKQFNSLLELILSKILKKQIKLPRLKAMEIVKVSPFFFMHWFLWALGFYLLALSLTQQTIFISAGLLFPLATSLGIMAIIAPGGVGIRESILIAGLSLTGLTVSEATSISVFSRLWFLCGEGFIFILAWFLNSRVTKQNQTP